MHMHEYTHIQVRLFHLQNLLLYVLLKSFPQYDIVHALILKYDP